MWGEPPWFTIITFSPFLFFLLLYSAGNLFAVVNPDGSYGQTVAIETPAGRNGIQPQIALDYNSNRGNGRVGVGWEIAGLAAISNGAPHFGINHDRDIVVQGIRIKRLSPLDTVFIPEVQNWSKFYAYGNDGQLLTAEAVLSGNRCGKTACYWIEETVDGMKRYYGGDLESDDGRIEAPGMNGSVRVWALSKVVDIHGNYYRIKYIEDQGEYYPTEIEYTLHESDNSVKTHFIEFTWQSRSDALSFYYGAAKVVTAKLLYAVSVSTSCRLLWIFPAPA